MAPQKSEISRDEWKDLGFRDISNILDRLKKLEVSEKCLEVQEEAVWDLIVDPNSKLGYPSQKLGSPFCASIKFNSIALQYNMKIHFYYFKIIF